MKPLNPKFVKRAEWIYLRDYHNTGCMFYRPVGLLSYNRAVEYLEDRVATFEIATCGRYAGYDPDLLNWFKAELARVTLRGVFT